jgi:hypothetical protein
MKSILALARTFPPERSQGWTIHFIERESRYWVDAQAGLKDASLFETGVTAAWDWANPSEWIRWFTDGERRYGKELWKLASGYLKQCETTQAYEYRKVWREGLEAAMKVKGSQGQPHVEWLKPEHPFTAISPQSEVHKEGVRGKLPPAHFHANHNEAQNSSLRRRANAYHRRQRWQWAILSSLSQCSNFYLLEGLSTSRFSWTVPWQRPNSKTGHQPSHCL